MSNELWISEVDGHLYRSNNFDKPVRRDMAYWTDKIRTVADLQAVIRASDKAFGGYISTCVRLITCESVSVGGTGKSHPVGWKSPSVRD
jgi:hypothetical protein